jgi:hypothetical protein
VASFAETVLHELSLGQVRIPPLDGEAVFTHLPEVYMEGIRRRHLGIALPAPAASQTGRLISEARNLPTVWSSSDVVFDSQGNRWMGSGPSLAFGNLSVTAR